MELKQANVQVTDTVLRLPAEFPPIPEEVIERFPSMGTWQKSVDRWWRANQNVLNDFSNAVTNISQVGGVLQVDGDNGAMFIRKIRGVAAWAEPDTAFYVNDQGFFSLKNSLTWNPDTNTLTITGTIIATAGTIGGFDIGSDYLRDVANSFGLSSTITGGNDVRLWAGNTFANRATAPFRVYEDGSIVATNATITGTITATSGTVGGFTIGATTLSAGSGSTTVTLSSSGTASIRFGVLSSTPSVYLDVNGYVLQNSAGSTVASLTGAAFPVLVVGPSGTQHFVYDSGGGGAVLYDGAGAELVRIGGSAAANITFVGDTNLYRSAANTLKTDDAFIAATMNVTGTTYSVGGTQVVTTRQAAIANAGTANVLDATYNQTQLETLFNAIGAKINEDLGMERTHGLIAT